MSPRSPASLLPASLLAIAIAIALGTCGSDDRVDAVDAASIATWAGAQTVETASTATPARAEAAEAGRAATPAGAKAAKAGHAATPASAATSRSAATPASEGARESVVQALPSAGPPEPEPRLALDHPKRGYPVIWVRNGHEVEIRTEPGGGKLVERAGQRTEFHSPTVFGVIDQRGDWAGVATPKLPNNELGWVKLDPKRLKAGWTRLSITIDLSERRAQLQDAGKAVKSFAVTVGAPGIETPTGRFAVTDTFRGDLTSSAYGCCALALSANQPKLPSGWIGGNRIAIHGTSGPLGIAASHGCVRAADVDVDELVDRVPLGTPVFIQA